MNGYLHNNYIHLEKEDPPFNLQSMDLESESSGLESVEDNELTPTTTATTITPDAVLNFGEGDDANNKIKANGSYSDEILHEMGASGNGDTNALPRDEHGVRITERAGNSVNSPPLMTKSPSGGSPPTTKGFGLKKWRRIRRDVVKDASASVDGSKVLKRGLSGAGNPPSKPGNKTLVEVVQNSEGSVGSANLFRNAGFSDGFVTRGSSLDSRYAVGSAFAAGAEDSENSEDRSSKSSTAASAPRVRHDLPAMSGYAQEKNKMKNLSGKSVGGSAQRVQQGKGRVESSKKPRGERIKIEKENSHSSMESDSRSSNFVYTQGDYFVTSNGKQSGGSMNYDAENSDEVHAGEEQFSENIHTGYRQDNVGELEDVLAAGASWEDRDEKSENHQPSAVQDPLLESILSLQSVQKALENEVQKFGEIGKVGSVMEDSTFGGPEIHGSTASDQFDSESIGESSSLESQVLSLTRNVKCLESSLQKTKAMLDMKELKVAELEVTVNGGKTPKEELNNGSVLQPEKSRESDTELEGLFKQKIEAEIECLALIRTVEELRVAGGDRTTLFAQEEALAGEQVQMLSKLGETGSKAATLKKQADELEKYCEDILEAEEVLTMQRRVCKVTSCFFIQLILIILVFWLLVLQLTPYSGLVVPT